MANAAPTGGHVKARPSAGVAALDTFTLESVDWSDDVDDLPLTYSFSSRVRKTFGGVGVGLGVTVSTPRRSRSSHSGCNCLKCGA